MINAGPSSVEVDAVDEVARLQLIITIELTIGGLIRARAEVINLGEDPYAVDDCVIAFPIPQNAREILDFAGHWGKERVPQRRPLGVGVHLREGRKGRTGAGRSHPVARRRAGILLRRWGDLGRAHRLERKPYPLCGAALHWHAGDRWRGTAVARRSDLATRPGLRHSMDLRLVRPRSRRGGTTVPPLPPRSRAPSIDHPPVTLNVWEAVYFDHDLDHLAELAECAAAIGVERYVLDDGWFGARRNDHAGLGDWTVSTEVWPHGLHPLVDKVTGLGMEFGLWFEPEMVNLDSAVARAHPDWIMATGDRLPVESRHQQVINLGIPECYAHIRDAIFEILAEYKISYIKWDHNRDLIDAGIAPDGRPGVHEQTLAFYRLVDEIKAAHPGLEIETAPPAAPVLILACWNAPTASG